MERLRQRDLLALLACLRDTYAMRDLDGFAAQLIAAVPQVVPAEITTYNEVNPRRRRVTSVDLPPDAVTALDLHQIWKRYMPEHPLITRYQQTRDGRAFKISDFLTQNQFHRLGLYNELYRRVQVEHQMAFALPTPPPLIIGIALNRGRWDFSERERLLLNLLRPHLVQAYRNAEAVTQLHQELAATRQVLEALALGVIVLGREGRVRRMTPQARHWLAAYFGSRARGADYEHALIRPLGEPRVHFALNCMVIGCPRLPQVPFRAQELDQQLEVAAMEFCNATQHVQLDFERRVVRFSAILRWYTKDFVNAWVAPSLIAYVNRYRVQPIPADFAVEFLPYDWTINKP